VFWNRIPFQRIEGFFAVNVIGLSAVPEASIVERTSIS
jgi:hypothetical protein